VDEDLTIADIIIDIRQHARDAIDEIGEPGSGWPSSLREESAAFTRVADWLAQRYRVPEDA
jgi:hypothetical protein